MMGKNKKSGNVWFLFWGFGLLCMAMSLVCLTGISAAQEYPTKPIQLTVNFPPGGGSDIIARLISPKLSGLLGQPVVVVNKSGGGGVIGVYSVIAAPADGYTISLYSTPTLLAPLIYKNITFNLLRDFSQINLAAIAPIILVVKSDAPWKTVEELIAYAKKNPGKISCGLPGYAGGYHFGAELFKKETGIDITMVPLEGSIGALQGVLGGHVQIAASDPGAAGKFLQTGSVRALVMMSKKRLSQYPDIPIGMEKGYPNLIFISIQGFAVRKQTPAAITAKLEKAFLETFRDEEIKEKIEKMGWAVESMGSKEATEFLSAAQDRAEKVAKAANIVPK